MFSKMYARQRDQFSIVEKPVPPDTLRSAYNIVYKTLHSMFNITISSILHSTVYRIVYNTLCNTVYSSIYSIVCSTLLCLNKKVSFLDVSLE